jgi:patatin-like phospholipase/acyl hydrolase
MERRRERRPGVRLLSLGELIVSAASSLIRLSQTDGGGILGVSELLIIEQIMKRIKQEQRLADVPKPCEYFDMIGGTGTGG